MHTDESGRTTEDEKESETLQEPDLESDAAEEDLQEEVPLH